MPAARCPLLSKRHLCHPVSSVSPIQPLLDWVYSPPSKKKVFPLIKNVNSISLSAGNHNGDIVDFTIIGTDLAQGGGWT